MKNTNTIIQSSNTKEFHNKQKYTSLTIGGETWQYYYADQYYDFRIYILDPNKKEYSFTRTFFRKVWVNKIRKPYVRPEVVKRYIEMFIRKSS